MRLLRRKKFDQEKDLETKNKIKELFCKKIKKGKEYKLLYGYNIEEYHTAKKHEKVLKYKNYILGYRENDMSIVIIETDKEFTECLKKYSFNRQDLLKTSYKNGANYYYFSLPKEDIYFYLIDENKDDDIFAYINQEDEIYEFQEFFEEFRRKRKKSKV